MNISIEQQEIIDELKKNNNVAINSVAGSGKTTCQLFIAKEFSDKNILSLTYNTMLRAESKIRAKLLKNLNIHTFHSFCNLHYCSGYTNNTISKSFILEPIRELNYDIIIIDEAQDMTELLYTYVTKIIRDNIKAQIIIFGDDKQSIYKYMGANSDYLSNPNKYFAGNWVNKSLNTSYRLSKPLCSFVNHFLGYNRIKYNVHNKINIAPEYRICDTFNIHITLKKIIENYIGLGNSFDDIMILAPTIKSKQVKTKYNLSPIRRLAYEFIGQIPIFIPDNYTNKNEKILRNKIIFTTFHQSKGMQRKMVIVYNIDESYNYFFNKTNEITCPNTIYVAISRASERLIVLQDEKKPHFKFINLTILKQISNIVGKSKIAEPMPELEIKKITKSVSELCDSYDFDFEITKSTIQNNINLLNIPQSIKNTNYYKLLDCLVETVEDISMITGNALPNFLQFYKTGNCNMNYIELNDKNQTELRTIVNDAKFDITFLKNMNDKEEFIKLWLKVAKTYTYKNEPHLNMQITNYNWITIDDMIKSSEYICDYFSSKLKFEYPITYENDNIIINGVIDCIDYVNKIVWEFKCVSELNEKHILQLTVYMNILINNKDIDNSYKFYLCNMLSGEIIEIKYDEKSINIFNKIELI